MSVSRSGRPRKDDLSFADHDVHHVRHDYRFLNAADSGPNDRSRDVRQHEITERGLEPDELAELRGMRVSLSIGTDTDPSPQGQIGHIGGFFETGFNLSGSEFLYNEPSVNTEDRDTDDSGQADFRAFFRDSDEVGQLTADRLDGYVGFSAAGDSMGGAGGMPVAVYYIDFDEWFGCGPIVDAVDDFSTSVLLDVNNCVAGVQAKSTYSLYYRVWETEQGRSRFGC